MIHYFFARTEEFSKPRYSDELKGWPPDNPAATLNISQ